jgi:membrane protein
MKALALAKTTFKDFSDDEATWKAAALAYYTVFALPPLLLLMLQVASAIWDPDQVRRTLTGEFESMMGRDVANQIQTMIQSAEQKASGSGMRVVLSVAGLIFGATGAFVALQSALNRAWEVKPDPKQGGIRQFITKRMLSLGMVLGMAFLLLVSLALTSALSAAGGALFGGMPKWLGLALNFVLSFGVITLLFAGMFKVLPDAKIAWNDVWVGATVTAVLFVLGKFLIGLYIGRSDPGSAFGAAGSLAVLLVWIYYAAVIVLLGAEFTQAWVKHKGRTIEPEEGAIKVIEQTVEAGMSGASHANGQVNKAQSADDIRYEMRETRMRMAETSKAVESEMSDRVTHAKERVNVIEMARRNPLAAAILAVAAGVAIASSRSDEKVIEAAQSGAGKALDKAKELADREGAEDSGLAGEVAEQRAGNEDRPNPIRRFVDGQLQMLGDELRRGADELSGSVRHPAGSDVRSQGPEHR